MHAELSEVTLLRVELSFRVVYCPSIDFMTGVTDIFRIKFRPAGLTVGAENLKIFLSKESKISW